MNQFRIKLPVSKTTNVESSAKAEDVATPRPASTQASNPEDDTPKPMPPRDAVAVSVMQEEESSIIWRQRARDSYEFMPALLEVMDRPASPTGRILVYIITIFFAALVVWATFSKVDIVAVAQGTIQPVGGAVPVQASMSGIVAQVLVEEGNRVEEGDILLTMDDREATVPRSQIEEQLLRQAMTARVNTRLLELLQAPIENRLSMLEIPGDLAALVETQAQARFASHEAEIESISAQIAEINTRLSVTQSAVTAREAAIPTYRQHERNLASLAERGLARQSDWLEVQIALRQQEESLMIEQGQLITLEAQAETLRATRDSRVQAARYSAVEQLLEAQQTGSIALLERERLETSGERLIVRAPRTGTISSIEVTPGATIAQPGLLIMTILPDDALIVEANLPSRDIGFVAEGMEVAVKVDAYPYTRFGHLEGVISAISPDSAIIEGQPGPTYQLTIEIASDILEVDGNAYPIGSGMQVSADIRTGDRTILNYFLSPIRASVDETLRER